MTTETFGPLPLAAIVASLTNPRRTFDPASLQELAESIRTSGVHQPVLVRPLPASRVADTASMHPRPTFELVSGERRLRASAMAQVDSIPAMVRTLTDAQVLEIQIVENLQRDDLQPLEESEGYERLMHAQEAEHTAEIRARNKVQADQPTAEPAKPSTPLDPAAQQTGGRGKGGRSAKGGKAKNTPAAPAARLSSGEAMQGIAAAMQFERVAEHDQEAQA